MKILDEEIEDKKIFTDNLLKVKVGGLWGLMDKNHNEILKPQFAHIGHVQAGVAIVDKYVDQEQNILKGVISANGKHVLVVPKYDKIRDFSEDYAAVCKNGKWGYIDKSGIEIIPLTTAFYDAHRFSENYARISVNNKQGFINKRGNIVI